MEDENYERPKYSYRLDEVADHFGEERCREATPSTLMQTKKL